MTPDCSNLRTRSPTLVADNPTAFPMSANDSRPFSCSRRTIAQSVRSRPTNSGLRAIFSSECQAFAEVFAANNLSFAATGWYRAYGADGMHVGNLRIRPGSRSRRSYVAVATRAARNTHIDRRLERSERGLVATRSVHLAVDLGLPCSVRALHWLVGTRCSASRVAK